MHYLFLIYDHDDGISEVSKNYDIFPQQKRKKGYSQSVYSKYMLVNDCVGVQMVCEI